MFMDTRFHRWLRMAPKVFGVVVLLLIVGRPYHIAEAAVAPQVDQTTLSNTPYRGFTVHALDSDELNGAATEWHANIVRLMMRPQLHAQRDCHCTNMQAWEKMLDELPAELDTAQKLHITVVLSLFEVPTEHFPEGAQDRAGHSAFWSDENSLRVMTQVWTEVAKICADRNQVIWYDLLNEPLDWQDYPSYPRKWPAWAQSLINSIRQIDTHHQIVIEPGPGGMVMGFKTFPKLKGDGLIYSFHQYLPLPYTLQGINQTKDTDQLQAHMQLQMRWPGDYTNGRWDKHRLEQELQPVIQFQKRTGARIFCGEFSVARWAPDATQWLQDNLDIFEEHNWDWVYHTFRGSPIFSVEYSDDLANPKNMQGSGQYTRRGQLLLQYLSHNGQ
jgi:aryl-phospho-beta-D-glucosidase BglC (GH1 family)